MNGNDKAVGRQKRHKGREKERFLYSPEPLNRWGDNTEVQPSPGGEKKGIKVMERQ